MRVSEFFSPVSFLRVLIKTHRGKPYRVMQMMPNDFKDYHICAKTFQYNKVPYTKVKALKFTKNTSVVLYKTYLEKNFQDATIARKTRKSGDVPCYDPVAPKVKLAKKGTLSAEKKSDLISMLKFMPLRRSGIL